MSQPEYPPGTLKRRLSFAPRRIGGGRLAAAVALVGAFAVGSGVTAAALQNRRPTILMLTPAPIAAMHDGSAVAVKGQVAELFGSKFILQDGSGRTLVETGRRGDAGQLVARSETVTVQGRFDHGSVHAQAISHEDGRNDLVGPPGPPHDGPLAWKGSAGDPARIEAPRPHDPSPGQP